AGLALQQVDLDNGYLRVFGKGAKERVVPVGGRAIEALRVYLSAGRPGLVKTKTGSALFLSERGGPLSRKTLWYLVQKHAARAGIERGVKPHQLRHSFASHLLGGGAERQSRDHPDLHRGGGEAAGRAAREIPSAQHRRVRRRLAAAGARATSRRA
nr:tyrosine-type recombinase/integrase [Opitutaceae bacterium]